MKTTNGKAFEILATLATATETGKLGYALAKQRRYIEDELKEFIEIRDKAIQDHSTGGKMTPEDVAAANTDIAEYIDLSCEFRVYAVDEDVFVSGGLNSAQMYVLGFMVRGADDGE